MARATWRQNSSEHPASKVKASPIPPADSQTGCSHWARAAELVPFRARPAANLAPGHLLFVNKPPSSCPWGEKGHIYGVKLSRCSDCRGRPHLAHRRVDWFECEPGKANLDNPFSQFPKVIEELSWSLTPD